MTTELSYRGKVSSVYVQNNSFCVQKSMKVSGIALLSDFDGEDHVTAILRSVAIKTVVFGRAVLSAPWGLHVDLPGRAVFHVVLQGRCWLSMDGTNPINLALGDVVLFPRADAHDMNDHPATPRRPITELLIKHPMTPDRSFCYGGNGPLTTLLCGAFEMDHPKLNLLGTLLPPFLHVKEEQGNTSDQLRALRQCIEAELRDTRPGQEAIVTRMTEAFLLRAICDHVLSSSHGERGLPAILRDRSIGPVVGLIHRHPERPWTVGTLARQANLSRTAFAARFKALVGASPQRYLQRYRFSRAIQLLRTTDAKIHEIACRVGYDSESSFSKAFKRQMGRAPGAYRQRHVGRGADPRRVIGISFRDGTH